MKFDRLIKKFGIKSLKGGRNIKRVAKKGFNTLGNSLQMEARALTKHSELYETVFMDELEKIAMSGAKMLELATKKNPDKIHKALKIAKDAYKRRSGFNSLSSAKKYLDIADARHNIVNMLPKKQRIPTKLYYGG